MKSPNTKSTSDLQNEVRKEINNLNRDINALEGRLSPGQFIDDAIFHGRGRNLGATLDHLKNNPVGTAFLSLGTILLMEDENHQTVETLSKNKVTAVRDSINSVKETVKNQLPHKDLQPGMTPSIGDIAKSKVTGIKDSISTKAQDLKTSFNEKKEVIQSKIHDVKSSVDSKTSEFGDTISERVDQVDVEGAKYQLKDKARNFVQSGKETISNLDPMAYMALGAGLGALTGASLPISEKEKTFVQEKITPKFGDLNSDLQNAINECSNILKDLVISDVKNFNVQLFKS